MTAIFLLIGVLMSGNIVLLNILPTQEACIQQAYDVQSLSDKRANVFCIKMDIREI